MTDDWSLKMYHVVKGKDQGLAGVSTSTGVPAAAPTPCLTEIREIETELKDQTK